MRKIHFSEEDIWQYQIGRSNIEIRSPDSKKYIVSLTYFLINQLLFTTGDAHKIVFPSHFEAKDQISMCPITPLDIKTFIKREIKNGKNVSRISHL